MCYRIYILVCNQVFCFQDFTGISINIYIAHDDVTIFGTAIYTYFICQCILFITLRINAHNRQRAWISTELAFNFHCSTGNISSFKLIE
ncbi:hypothetical protein D3C87_1874880 [compost metagenome]